MVVWLSREASNCPKKILPMQGEVSVGSLNIVIWKTASIKNTDEYLKQVLAKGRLEHRDSAYVEWGFDSLGISAS